MAVDAPHRSAAVPIRQVLPLPTGCGWRRAAEIATACAAVALAHVVQRYWPALAGESAGRQLAFVKAMLLIPMLLSIDRIRGWGRIPGRPVQPASGRALDAR
jgi:hypothetical protein